MRVLLAASYEGEPDTGGLTEDQIHPMALILITNRLRNEAAETFRYFRGSRVFLSVSFPATIPKQCPGLPYRPA